MLRIETTAKVQIVNAQYFPALGMISIQQGQSSCVKGVNNEGNCHAPEETCAKQANPTEPLQEKD